MTSEYLRERISNTPARSAWSKGVKVYAEELLDTIDEAISEGYFDEADLDSPKLASRALLNGASDWSQYSWGGCSLIYNEDIAKRLCTPSELKRTRNGRNKPNPTEEWLDVQARALWQAERLILAIVIGED